MPSLPTSVVTGDSRKTDQDTVRFPHRISKSRIKTASIFPLTSRNYKVSATIGITTRVATTVRAILDTGAGPNLIKESVLPDDWERYRIVGDTGYLIVGAGGKKVESQWDVDPSRGVRTPEGESTVYRSCGVSCRWYLGVPIY
jgi:Retroviral aspartyl protease